MKKSKIFTAALFLTATAAISFGVAYTTLRAFNTESNSTATTKSVTQTTADGEFKFASNATQGILPDLTTASEMAVNAVVNIENVQTIELRGPQGGFDPFEFFFGPQQRQPQSEPQKRSQRSGGSGVIISSDGYIVTNNHVVANADELNITLYDGKSYQADLIGTDPSTDIALIKIDATDLPVLQFGNSDDLRLGEWVLAVGNPMGLTSTVTAGIISAKGRSLGAGQRSSTTLDIESFIQTDAVVNPGNSGGALVTTEGRLIGINTILKSNTGSYIGYSFAVPSSIVRKVVADLREFGAVQRALLGIAYSEINPQWIEKFAEELKVEETEGLYVGEVQEEGAAKEAGIRKNDVIVAVNDTPIRTSAALQEALAKLRPGDKIKISAKRDGQMKHFDVVLRNRAGETELLAKDAVDVTKLLGGEFQTPNAATLKKLGIKGGLQVVAISPEGLLAKSRVRNGFIITHVNERPVSSVSDLNRITDKVTSIDGFLPDGRQVIYQIVNN